MEAGVAGKPEVQEVRAGVRVEAPTPEMVLTVQAERAYPCLSVLMTTEPGARMSTTDRAQLNALVAQALERVGEAGLFGAERHLRQSLPLLVEAAAAAPARSAVVLLCSRATQRVVSLGIEVVDRVVLDQTFATRDLVRALHRTPRHAVLLLEHHRARLLDGSEGGLRQAPSGGFPVHAQDPTHSLLDDGGQRAFCAAVDQRLATYRALHPSPLVVAGPKRLTQVYLRHARSTGRLAGVLTTGDTVPTLDELARRVRAVLDRYLASREREALDLLETRTLSGRVASGMKAAWLAARHERPEMLAVEPGLLYPARLSADGDEIERADDVRAPDVIDDAVDELVEQVLARGGWVAFVGDGSLDRHGRIALTLR